jgi:O-antigen/teichoic acid export membrane protein
MSSVEQNPTGEIVQPSSPAEPIARGALRAHLRDPLYRTGYLLIAGTGITAVVGFVFWALAAHAYSAETIGLSSAAISAMGLVSGVCTLGLDAALVRYLPTAGMAVRGLVVRTYAVTVTLSLALGAAAALTSGLWSPRLRFLGDHAGWLVGFALATAAWTVFSLQDNVMTGLRSPQWVPLENSIYSISKLVLVLALAGTLTRAGPFVAWNAPVGVALLGVNWLIFKRLIPRWTAARPVGSFDRRQFRTVAGANYAGGLFSMASTLLLPVLVADETNLTQTAYFYLPWTITVALRLVALNMTTSLTVEGALDEQQMALLTRRAFLQTLRLVLPLAIVCGLAAPWVLRVFGSRYADEGTTLLRLLTAAVIPNVIVYLGIAVARVAHNARAVVAIQAAEGVLMVALSAVLLPIDGIDGVGIAWFVSQLLVAAGLLAGMLRPLLASLRAPPR